MTHTVESLMALHDEVVGRSKLTEEGEAEARSRFLAALTETLSFNPDWADFENGRECGRLEVAQPVREPLKVKVTDKWESARVADYNRGWNDCLFASNIEQAAQPVREPLSPDVVRALWHETLQATKGPLPIEEFATLLAKHYGIGVSNAL